MRNSHNSTAKLQATQLNTAKDIKKHYKKMFEEDTTWIANKCEKFSSNGLLV